MAFGRLERSAPPRPMGEINMTPLIDVMLVLLVIFMVTAPLMASSLKLQLPASDAATPPSANPVLAVSVDAAGTLRLGDEPIALAQLGERFAAAAARDPRTEVHLRADRAVAYGRVAELIGAAQKAGLLRIGFVAEPTPSDAATAPDAATRH
jgi:biopolymer transport protein ExbD/biopolymer transport protein TolR